nr:hypothetical protein [Methylomarinum sp. Ch1-1]MDP4519698.1 hypothetical protein [Methylomarinum sp. Ch1-1]
MHQKPVRFLSSAHPTRTGRADQAQRIRQRRAASRSKPPKTATGGKIGHYGIQAHCLAIGLGYLPLESMVHTENSYADVFIP